MPNTQEGLVPGTNKTPVQVLHKGNDARIAAVRNNLVRKGNEVITAIGMLSDDEFRDFDQYLDAEALVTAAQSVRSAMTARRGKLKPVPAQPATKAS